MEKTKVAAKPGIQKASAEDLKALHSRGRGQSGGIRKQIMQMKPHEKMETDLSGARVTQVLSDIKKKNPTWQIAMRTIEGVRTIIRDADQKVAA